MKKIYRIATDGEKFRIEILTRTFWRKRGKWIPLRFGGLLLTYVALFDGQLEAKTELDLLVKRDLVSGWKPVGDPIEVEWHVSSEGKEDSEDGK